LICDGGHGAAQEGFWIGEGRRAEVAAALTRTKRRLRRWR